MLEQMLGVRAFQLLGYAKPPDRSNAGAPEGMRRITGGWCRASDRFCGTDAACKVTQLLAYHTRNFCLSCSKPRPVLHILHDICVHKPYWSAGKQLLVIC